MTQVNKQPPVNPPAPLNPNMSLAELMNALFDAAAGLYNAIRGSLQEQNENLTDLTDRMQAVSDELDAVEKKPGSKNKDQATIGLLKDQLQELQTRIQKANATMQTNLSAASTDVAILGKWVSTMKQAIDGIVPNL